MTQEHKSLVELISWIDLHTSGLSLPSDEKSLLAAGCFDVALEHQAAIALLYSSSLHGSMLALLRVISESLVRGLWLLHCANEAEIKRFKKGIIKKHFNQLVVDFENTMGTPDGVLSGFKETAWDAMNGFTHTGFLQVTRRHSIGLVGSNYDENELAKSLGVAGALGLIAAGQLIAMAGRNDLTQIFVDKMSDYATPSP